jgi:peptidoglycan/LPS O-acetylase OafA/YrhL
MLPFLLAWFSLLMATGLFGCALSLRFERSSAVVSYVARASFWIYLFHHPIVGLTHVDLSFVDLPGWLEWLLTGGTTLGVCLLSYEFAVRRTWLGELLNGVREGSRRKDTAPRPATLPEKRRAA